MPDSKGTAVTGRTQKWLDQVEAMRKLAGEGVSKREAASRLGLTYGYVCSLSSENGIKFVRADKNAERNARIVAMYRQGVTLDKIGQQFGMSRQAVQQLLARRGVSSNDGGMAVLQKLKTGGVSRVEQARARREAASIAKYGVGLEMAALLRAEGVIRRYRQHRANAAVRGIAFDLTFAQWWAIWQASGHAFDNGRGHAGYCMSRIKDKGGYTIGNVHVQRTVENSREAVEVWRGQPEKPNRGVFMLYPGAAKPWMAKVGKVHCSYHATEAEAVEARRKFMADNGLEYPQCALGKGKGWTFLERNRARPYQVQVKGTKPTYHATQSEAEAEYKRRCAEIMAARVADKAPV